MNSSSTAILDRAKHGLYLFSIALLLFLTALAFWHSPADGTHLDFFSTIMSRWEIGLMTVAGAVLLAAFLLFVHRKLCRLSTARQRILLLITALVCIGIQYTLLFTLRATLRYDHLKVFDQALELFRTGEISLTYGEGYFAQYPFNIPITLFNYGVLNLAKLFGIPESYYMLVIQSVYLFGTDLAVFFSWQLLRILRSERTANLFALICFVNPLLYMYGFACYTTILMLPFLMGNLLLFVCLLREKKWKKKLLLAFLLGITLVLGIKIRANLLITLIAFAGYLLIHFRNPDTFVEKKKHGIYLLLAAALGALLCYGACMSLEHTYVKGDYSDTQLPPSYYFLFSSKLDSLGSYNEEDHVFIQGFETEEEKNAAAWSALFARLADNGLSGNAYLADYKLSFTWSDGIDDYAEFIHTTDHYGTLHSFLGGSRKDFFALYCHMFHVMTMGLLVGAVLLALKRRCNTPFYLIYLNLLGAMLFHLIWEAGWAYSISFTLLVLMLAAEGLSFASEHLAVAAVSSPNAVGKFVLPGSALRTSLISRRILRTATVLSLAVLLVLGLLHGHALFDTPFRQMEYAVVQDMSEGENLLPLLTGETISQTFTTDRAFNHIGCKVLNPTGTACTSVYRIELLDTAGNVLGSRDFEGSEILNKDYCYVRFDSVIPDGAATYEIRITGLDVNEADALTFLYYNSGNWDIYPSGSMSGLNADEKSDLTFVVYDSVTKCFFN